MIVGIKWKTRGNTMNKSVMLVTVLSLMNMTLFFSKPADVKIVEKTGKYNKGFELAKEKYDKLVNLQDIKLLSDTKSKQRRIKDLQGLIEHMKLNFVNAVGKYVYPETKSSTFDDNCLKKIFNTKISLKDHHRDVVFAAIYATQEFKNGINKFASELNSVPAQLFDKIIDYMRNDAVLASFNNYYTKAVDALKAVGGATTGYPQKLNLDWLQEYCTTKK